jgi:hypothetical protein
MWSLDCMWVCFLQTAIIQLYLKRRHRQTDTAFDEQCRFNHKSRGALTQEWAMARRVECLLSRCGW